MVPQNKIRPGQGTIDHFNALTMGSISNKQLQKPSLLLLILLTNIFFVSGQTIVEGKTVLDSTWEKTIYASYIESLYDMYKTSERTIVAQSTIDDLGNWKLTLPIKEHSYLVRLHVRKKKEPVASLIIGTKDENHCFLAISHKNPIGYIHRDTTRIFTDFSSRESSINQMMMELSERIKKWDSLDKNTLGTKAKITLREKAAKDLLNYADTASAILPALYAIHAADFGFNNDMIVASIERVNERLGPHPYLEVYPVPDRTRHYLLYGILLICIPIGVLAIYRIRNLYDFQQRKSLVGTLSIREKEVLDLILSGKRNKEISDMLHIEVSTVKSHVNNIYAKLDVASRKELSRYKDL